MKKYNYLNKSNKLLLAAMTIPLAVSVLPVENTYANEIPKLNVYELNGFPKLEWATEILEENIITKTSFENGDEIPSLISNGKTGEQSIVPNIGYDNSIGLKIGKTTPNLGNSYSGKTTSSNISQLTFTEKRKYIENGEYLSVSLKAKTDKSATLSPIGIGGPADKQLSFQELFKSKVSFEFAEKVNEGQNYFYVTNPEEFKRLVSKSTYYTVNKKSTTGAYSYLEILTIDESSGKVTVKSKFSESFEKDEPVLSHRHINPLNFQSRTINSNEWQTLNFNAYINDSNDYNTLLRGFQFWLRTVSEGNTVIDDIRFGYATEVEVFREGKSIYKGYLSDFHDTTIKDNLKPNKVKDINGVVSNDFNIVLNVSKPEDNGVKTNYQIQSIAKNGNKSELSLPQEIELKSDVVKYKYTISNKSSDKPITESLVTNNINIPLKSINLEEDYIHIQAIDGNGNIGEIESFKIEDIVDTSGLENAYEKLKSLEKSNDYNDFIEFIEEVKTFYGDNIPKDLKNRLQELAAYHGENTSFLLLEEGDFRLTTSDINDFGHVRLTAKKQKLTTDFKSNFGIIDARGTQEGWSVTVSATPFTVETFDGFVGVPHELPLGSLALNIPTNIEQIGNVHNSQLPSITLNELSVIDGENHAVQLLNADKNKGMGEFKFSFEKDALALTVDAVTAKIDTVNYPEQNTPYTSTVTWNLITSP